MPWKLFSSKLRPNQCEYSYIIPKPQPLTRQEKKVLLPSKEQPSPILGAASSLGGPISLSSRNFASNELAALPNSKRLNGETQGIDARRDAELGSYLEQLQQQVKQQWIPGLTQDSRRTVVYFVVSRSGQVSSLGIRQRSGSIVTDEAALSAVKRAAPFAPLPTGYSKDYINIQFTFNINVYGELELWGSR